MTVFQLSFWAMTGVRKLSSPAADNLNNKIRIGVFCGFGGIFAAACLITNVSEESLYQAAYEAEGRIQRTVKQITGADMSSTDGRVSRGNLYPAGRDQLELITDELSTETLYLKGFSGGDYQGGEWQENRDEEIYDLMEKNSLHWGRWKSWIPGILPFSGSGGILPAFCLCGCTDVPSLWSAGQICHRLRSFSIRLSGTG